MAWPWVILPVCVGLTTALTVLVSLFCEKCGIIRNTPLWSFYQFITVRAWLKDIERNTNILKQNQLEWYKVSRSCEGFLEVGRLKYDIHPNFALEIATVFLEQTDVLINELANFVTFDFQRMDDHVGMSLGSSAIIGARRLQNQCIAFHNELKYVNIEGCLNCLQELENEYFLLKSKLKKWFELEQQKVAASTNE